MNILLTVHALTLAFFMLGGQVPQEAYTIHLTLPFPLTYLAVVSVQMFILLKVSSAAIFSRLATKWGLDPHHSALPMITSVTSLLTSAAMAALFALMRALGDPNGVPAGSTTSSVGGSSSNNATSAI